MNGARWVQQELLESNPSSPLSVYAVWYNMFPGDSRAKWRADLLTDTRVSHFWDERRAVGNLYFQDLPRMWERRAAETVLPQDLVLWDAYLLYSPDAAWGEQLPETVSWGATILRTRDQLKRDLAEMLKR